MRPTNLLILMVDQHNRAYMGCAGHPQVKTPNLDALAARGTRFANSYTPMPICVPARASMATGRYPHQLESWDNAKPYLGTEAASWGHRLTAAGHHVTTVGKLHYRSAADDTGFPDQRIPLHVHEGDGDLYGLLRGDCPPRPRQRKYLYEAGPGDSEYLRYDRGVTAEACRWLREEAADHGEPWALMVSWVSPHTPLIAPREFLDLYPPESIQLPPNWREEDWPRHPALDLKRHIQDLDRPVEEAVLRQAIAAYYALCSFIDDQLGQVLRALDEQGLANSTRVIYTNDHGDTVGQHGLWYKGTMYEGSVGASMIVAGPDVPRGKVSATNVSLIDVFPSALDALGVAPAVEDAALPGESLWKLAAEPSRPERPVFSEYHAGASRTGMFMLRKGRYKYVYYAEMPAQLFDLEADPTESVNLAEDPTYADVRAAYERELRAICDPDEVNARAVADQQARIAGFGGKEHILSRPPAFTHSPPPAEFADAPEVAQRH
ncbi:MAG: sulfatase-like hydrolase/transferase [Chloroflexota bacterium]